MMIDGVEIIPLKKIADERGAVYKFISLLDISLNFGEVYFSKIHYKVVKGWHLHKETTIAISCIIGKVKYVLYDERENSPTKNQVMEIFLGDDNYSLVIVPAGIWNGLKGVSINDSIVAVFMNKPYTADEIIRIDPFKNHIPYNWELKHG